MLTLQTEGQEAGASCTHVPMPCQLSPLVDGPPTVAFGLVHRSGPWCTAGPYATLVGSVFPVPFRYLVGWSPSQQLSSPPRIPEGGGYMKLLYRSFPRTEESPELGSSMGLSTKAAALAGTYLVL